MTVQCNMTRTLRHIILESEESSSVYSSTCAAMSLLVEQLNTTASQLTLLISALCMIFGSVGLILNLIILTRRSLRSNCCSLYFLSSTCVTLFILFVILPFRILVGTFNIDPTISNEPLCKIQVYIFSIARALSLWLISLACVNGYFCRSPIATLRALSSMKFARRSICVCTLLLFIVYVHYRIYFEINSTLDQFGRSTSTCVARRASYRTFAPVWNLIWYALLPSTVMFLFGILTMANIRRTRRQIVPQNYRQQLKRSKINSQL
jgi:hypothetical protein